uniref:Uncharacterized protein n=1 Tax=viral metagenome TaxID=1070528 RepID=A0A6M3LPS5_9ZZZZ
MSTKRKSLFEQAVLKSTEVTFGIPSSRVSPQKDNKIACKLRVDSPILYSPETETVLCINQESGVGTIYLDQKQGSVLAKELMRIFG